MTFKIATRKNWARWIFAVVFVLAKIVFLSSVLLAPQIWLALPLTAIGPAITQFVLQGTALVLLFTPDASRWFRARTDRAIPVAKH